MLEPNTSCRYSVRVGDEFTTINTGEISKDKSFAIFACLNTFTPTCSTQQLTKLEENYGKFQESIDEVYCLSVNDSFVMMLVQRLRYRECKITS